MTDKFKLRERLYLHELIQKHFEDESWYRDRLTYVKLVLTASVGLITVLVLSRDRLPQQSVIQYWWLYRSTLVLAGASAVAAFFLYYYTYRLRYFVRLGKEIQSSLSGANKIARYYLGLQQPRERTETYLFWMWFALSKVLFSLSFISAAMLVILCFAAPPKSEEESVTRFLQSRLTLAQTSTALDMKLKDLP